MVKVVVNDRTEGAGEEKVLPSSPQFELIAPPAVAMVPALEYAASDTAVSPPLVDTVGAADFCPVPGGWFPWPDEARDGSLWECGRFPSCWIDSWNELFNVRLALPPLLGIPDRGYGVFLTESFLFLGPVCRLFDQRLDPESEEFLRLARRFIQLANG